MAFGRKNIVFFIVFFSYSSHAQNNYCMELKDCLKSNDGIIDFLDSNFIKIDSNYKNPIFPYKIDYRNSCEFTFCNLPIVDSWAFKNGKSFTFFMLVKYSSGLKKSISNVFGQPDVESQVEINNLPAITTTYNWNRTGVNIIMQKFFNSNRIAQFNNNNLTLVIIGNMKFRDIVYLGKVSK